jgi:hypothetical protein
MFNGIISAKPETIAATNPQSRSKLTSVIPTTQANLIIANNGKNRSLPAEKKTPEH